MSLSWALLQREREFAAAFARAAVDGIRLDPDQVAKLIAEHTESRAAARRRVQDATGGAVANPKSSPQVSAFLAAAGRYELPRSLKTGVPGAGKGALEPYAHQGDQLCADILAYRRHDTALGLLLEPRRLLCGQGDGRVRTSILTLAANTGRTSSRNENLQQVCYDSATEILTSRGWLPFPEVTGGQLVAQWEESGRITFVQPSRVVHEMYNGPMIRIAGEHHEQVVTPNHRVYSRKQPTGDLAVEPARDWLKHGAAGKNVNRKLIRGGELSGRRLSEAELLALFRAVAVQADGSLRDDTRFIPLSFTKQRKVRRARELGFDVRETPAQSKGLPVYQAKAYAADCAPWLVLPGKAFNIPELLKLDAGDLQLFLAEVMFWDGDYTRGQAYNQAVERTAAVDAVELAALLSGHSTCRSVKHVAGRDYACVQVHRDTDRYASRTTVTEVPSDGMVHCVEVPSGAVVVRRSGKVIISGNSRQGGMRACHLTSAPGETCGISADFSSVEVRVGAALSGDESMKRLIELGDAYPERKKEFDFHWRTAITCYGPDATKEHRYNCKRVNFAKMYGSGKRSAAAQVGIPVQEVSAAFDAFDAVAPQYGLWDAQMRQYARNGGKSYLTYSGREVYLSGKGEHAAGNAAIQGTAREFLVDAVLKWRNGPWGHALLVPVHDEVICWDIPADEAADATAYLVQCMETQLHGVAVKAEASEPWTAWPDASLPLLCAYHVAHDCYARGHEAVHGGRGRRPAEGVQDDRVPPDPRRGTRRPRRQAGRHPGRAELPRPRLGRDEVLQAGRRRPVTYEEVTAELAARGALPAQLAVFPRRFEPVEGQPCPGPGKVFLVPVECADGRYLAACFSFGQPDPDPLLDWAPAWRSVEGPMTRPELEDLGRELARQG